MGLPFKNGFELAQAMGFGKMYQASKEQNENNIQMESKNMKREIIRLTESDLHNIVKETVNKVLNEIGDTEDGQRLLGRLAARKSTSGKINDYYNVSDYAKEKRNGNLKMQDKFAKGFHSEKNKIKEGN